MFLNERNWPEVAIQIKNKKPRRSGAVILSADHHQKVKNGRTQGVERVRPKTLFGEKRVSHYQDQLAGRL